jgi:hypothetical protein
LHFAGRNDHLTHIDAIPALLSGKAQWLSHAHRYPLEYHYSGSTAAMPDKRSQANSHGIDGICTGPAASWRHEFRAERNIHRLIPHPDGKRNASMPFHLFRLSWIAFIATTSGIPSVDIRKSCQAAAGTMADLIAGSTVQHDLDVCLGSEQAVREQLIKNWRTYSSAEKTQCVQPSVYLPSYIEWLTCLEMGMSVRRPDTKPP